MHMKRCGTGFSRLSLVSRLVRFEDRECLRAKGHEDSHLVYDTMQNKYYLWKPDPGCEECDDNESCCDVYEQVLAEIAQSLIPQQVLVPQLAS